MTERPPKSGALPHGGWACNRPEHSKLFANDPFRNKPIRPWFSRIWRNAPVLPSAGHVMSPILPISFVATLVCVLVAIDWALYQQILFVGAALSATVWVCSLEAWSCQEAPSEERGRRPPLQSGGRIAASEPLPAVDASAHGPGCGARGRCTERGRRQRCRRRRRCGPRGCSQAPPSHRAGRSLSPQAPLRSRHGPARPH